MAISVRRTAAAATCIFIATAAGGRARSVDSGLGNAPFNEYRTIGSHNSYHVEPVAAVKKVLLDSGDPEAAIFVRAVSYSHPSLIRQLDLGVRQLELDVYIDSKGGAFLHPAALLVIERHHGQGRLSADRSALMLRPGFKVMHDPDVDWGSTCPTFDLCLSQISNWSIRHPKHFPIIVNLDLKSGPAREIKGVPSSTVVPFDIDAIRNLEQHVSARVGRDKLITPDTIRQDYDSPRERIVAAGWPRLSELRGKILFVLTNDALAEACRALDPTLRGRLFFPIGPAGEKGALFIERLDPSSPDIALLRCAGYIVQTTSDYKSGLPIRKLKTLRLLALRSGANGISTNYIVRDPRVGNYRVTFSRSRFVERASLSPASCLEPIPSSASSADYFAFQSH